MKKIQLRLFDRRRNQNFWFHFCYIPMGLWQEYQKRFKVNNMDTQVKEWLEQDFGLKVTHMEDINAAKDSIKNLYSEAHPDIFLDTEGDRQGWTRVWLSGKIKKLLEVEQ